MISGFNLSFDIKSFIGCNCLSEDYKDFKASTYSCLWYSIVFACFSKGSPNEDEVNLFCSIICFWLEGNISLPVSYSYLSIFSDNKADIFAASVLI